MRPATCVSAERVENGDGLESEIVAAVREQRWPRLADAVHISAIERAMLSRHASPGWGAHEETLRLLMAVIRELRPRRILEFGSGVSSLVIAMTLQGMGSGSLLSLDESERFAARTHSWLTEEGLLAHADVLHCPVRRQRILEKDTHCYDLSAVSERIRDLDLVFVDGPNSMPLIGHPGARFGTLPLIMDRLGPGALLILDDAGRRAERRIAAQWAEFVGIRALGLLDLGRGLSIFRAAA